MIDSEILSIEESNKEPCAVALSPNLDMDPSRASSIPAIPITIPPDTNCPVHKRYADNMLISRPDIETIFGENPI